jgi:hypothetical protein
LGHIVNRQGVTVQAGCVLLPIRKSS